MEIWGTNKLIFRGPGNEHIAFETILGSPGGGMHLSGGRISGPLGGTKDRIDGFDGLGEGFQGANILILKRFWEVPRGRHLIRGRISGPLRGTNERMDGLDGLKGGR